MITLKSRSFDGVMYELGRQLVDQAQPVDNATWQSQSTRAKPGMSRTWELEDACFEIAVPDSVPLMAQLVQPNLPWADVHFNERVSGIPMNPPPSHKIWPFAQASNDEHMVNERFSHTYPERFWPKHAGSAHTPPMCSRSNTSALVPEDDRDYCDLKPQRGLWFPFGDLGDVIDLLQSDPTTRQAYLPIWFPEDTGAVEGQRVPCSLGYHFRIRHGQINCSYYMRSCDYLRHLRDDIYHAMRLMQFVRQEVHRNELGDLWSLGSLSMHIGSLHIFEGDRVNMAGVVEELKLRTSLKMMEAMR